MKACAFYYDNPTIKDEIEMKRKLQRDYDDILTEGWRPVLDNRRSLLTWACQQKNSAEDNCENYHGLLDKYGPNYDSLKAKLGNVRGLFNDSD